MHSHPRLNTYHSQKQRVLGHHAAQPAPAWRQNARVASGSGDEGGSKILLSRLPADVMEDEVEVRHRPLLYPNKRPRPTVYNHGTHRHCSPRQWGQ